MIPVPWKSKTVISAIAAALVASVLFFWQVPLDGTGVTMSLAEYLAAMWAAITTIFVRHGIEKSSPTG